MLHHWRLFAVMLVDFVSEFASKLLLFNFKFNLLIFNIGITSIYCMNVQYIDFDAISSIFDFIFVNNETWSIF